MQRENIPDNAFVAGIHDSPVPLAQPLWEDEDAKEYAEGSYWQMLDHEQAGAGGQVSVESGAAEVRLVLLNPEGNSAYRTFEITLEESGETLYRSNLIKPGMCIEGFPVERPLEKGNYKAKLAIRAYDMESLDEISVANMMFDLIAH